AAAKATRAQAVEAWMHVGKALALSGDSADRKLAGAIAAFIKEMPITQATVPQRPGPEQVPKRGPVDIGPQR
ncbi:MAG TPA: conjugal transfer protein TraS, partial [Rubrivivax sp.]|nr:conjugal transfer protein TraS [Rubrivivax sp.]